MTSPDLISVVIPAYNAGLYLGEALESVFAQTYPSVEVIVVDDGSDDDTAEVARSFGARVSYVRQERAGAGAARNAALDHARGPYLAFLDADDRFTPTKLEHQMAALASGPELDMVYGHVREFFSPDLPAAQRAQHRQPGAPAAWLSPNLMLIRRESFDRVGPFATDVGVGETVDWHARAVESGLRWHVLPEVVLERRLHARNSTIQAPTTQADYLRVLKAAIDRRRAQAER